MKAGNGINLVKLKLESKDQLLARVWHSIELVLFQPCMLGVGYLWLLCLWISIMCRDAIVL
jgi:hypothetical protein